MSIPSCFRKFFCLNFAIFLVVCGRQTLVRFYRILTIGQRNLHVEDTDIQLMKTNFFMAENGSCFLQTSVIRTLKQHGFLGKL